MGGATCFTQPTNSNAHLSRNTLTHTPRSNWSTLWAQSDWDKITTAGLERTLPSVLLEATSPHDTLMLDIHPPDWRHMWEDTFLWCCVLCFGNPHTLIQLPLFTEWSERDQHRNWEAGVHMLPSSLSWKWQNTFLGVGDKIAFWKERRLHVNFSFTTLTSCVAKGKWFYLPGAQCPHWYMEVRFTIWLHYEAWIWKPGSVFARYLPRQRLSKSSPSSPLS